MERDFRDGFYGIEACLFENEADTQKLLSTSRARGFRIGVHFPLRAGKSLLRDALFMDADEQIRDEALRLVRDELDYLRNVRPDYVLFHYPKPVILDDRVNWDEWHFSDRTEYGYESDCSLEMFAERSDHLFVWLTAASREYGFTPVLEFDALNSYIYEHDVLEGLLKKYPDIRLCLDTGRIFLQQNVDPSFRALPVIRKYAKYAEVIHLWNLQYTKSSVKLRYPVLPDQRPEDGWAPIGEYLAVIREENPQVKIQFEHRSELVSREDLQRCYEWVDECLRITNHS
ncbi:sugar phosphate isomerase/epimerase [Paenibacillus sp. XY044]|uniref:sugar phosphate isomerase/epimerase n=1 Tax=Paenibacillus sp. XY044 TaxID=2026089 RepID=UPI0026BE4ACF|nr:sugar phosphate isomerase/epimerase [Paenibacillus sp. XY044]